jgi:Spy/CpxP family protein refolding chaperone
MRFAKYTIAVLLLAGAVFAVFAQQGPAAKRRPMRAGAQAAQNGAPQALSDYLKLTADQEAQIKAIQTSHREAVQPFAEQMRAKSTELRNAMKADPVDSAKVTALRAEIGKLREDMKAQRDSFAAKFRNVLSVEQQKSLEALEQALKLQAAARQAAHLGLINPPENAGEWGWFGPGRGMMRYGLGPRR